MEQNKLESVYIDKEQYYKIANHDTMRPFFMSIVSHSNHWMFISSNGGLTAGRQNAESSLFPYYTDDKITESAEITGSKSIFAIQADGHSIRWEPFSQRFDGQYKVSRNLYKSGFGNKIRFEEINHDLNLTFHYEWSFSDAYGFVKKSKLTNTGNQIIQVSVLDGIQNILPYGVGSDLQNSSSNLVDAYKRNELDKTSGLGIFALSAIIVDKAEPSEALKANIAWSIGMDDPIHLLSSLQLKAFRKGLEINEETDVKAEKGAYFISSTINLAPDSDKEWIIVAEVNQNHAAIARTIKALKQKDQLRQRLTQDIQTGTKKLIELNASADGLQFSADRLRDSRHFANSLFNIMRGGVFDYNYQIEKHDFINYLEKANNQVFLSVQDKLATLSDIFSLFELQELANTDSDLDFRRLCLEYMPLKFSRRHGDPSRPWNKFSINTRSEEDGSKILDYEGNWRDIFQNWEALALSFPGFIESMIHKFLNASTFDGYNPYRVIKDGFDWESIEPDNPWSYIGYWGDHQIIYLLKFLEFIEKKDPGKLSSLFNQDIFVYAHVPYLIKKHKDIVANPKDTIAFDFENDHHIRARREEIGADGALLLNNAENIHHINLIEKILATVLAKISNLIPEGGIWMNTQRPEWNDANNALVGNGVSMVTLYYLRRFLKYLADILQSANVDQVMISAELVDYFNTVTNILNRNEQLLNSKINDQDRRIILDALGESASVYRQRIYSTSFSGEKLPIHLTDVSKFTNISIHYLEHAIRANKRSDGLYHAYNLITLPDDREASISYLSEMLEGQVAVLSSGYLSSENALSVLDSLKSSALFRPDQYSYILYPDKDLAGFLQRNTISENHVEASALLKAFVQNEDTRIIEKDINGTYHFNGNFKNAGDLSNALEKIEQSSYPIINQKEKEQILQIFELVFDHKSFTGRSGTFYGYEGLGSIYWHMVSKLLLAVQECCLKAIRENSSTEIIGRLLEHYYEINAGIGVHKPPSLYGAFSIDPYSHTPAGKGAQQPGMTGQVKEDILCRFGELGVFVDEGKLHFDPCLLRKDEFLGEPQQFEYIDVHAHSRKIPLHKGSLCFTYCQVPVVYAIGEENSLQVIFEGGAVENIQSLTLDLKTSKLIFERSGEVLRIEARINKSILR